MLKEYCGANELPGLHVNEVARRLYIDCSITTCIFSDLPSSQGRHVPAGLPCVCQGPPPDTRYRGVPAPWLSTRTLYGWRDGRESSEGPGAWGDGRSSYLVKQQHTHVFIMILIMVDGGFNQHSHSN